MALSNKTALILVDPYNDFLHPTGKLTSRLQPTLAQNDTIINIKKAPSTARSLDLSIYYALHHQWTPEAFEKWGHMSSSNISQQQTHFFEAGTFGADIFEGLQPQEEKGEVVVNKHWNSNAFWNTDLDHQLRQRDITAVVFAGLTANTCLEATARHAYECGYHVTMLHDATAAWNKPLMNAARDLVYPLFANAVLSADEWIAKCSG